MMINIIAPEWAFGRAYSDVSSVRMLKARFAEIQDRDGVPWSDSHIHYANMGGFAIQFADSDAIAGSQEIPSIKDLPEGIRTPQILQRSMQKISNAIGKVDWALDRSNILAIEKANSIVSQGYLKKERILNMSYTNWVGNLTLLCGNLWVVDANQLLLARERGIIDKLPYISQDSLDDHNNGDIVVKLLALLQISWMFIQLGVRLARNLPTSQLEIFTLSFAICSSITYIMLIDKPQDVRTSYTIKAVRHPSVEDLIYMANAGPVGNVFKSNIWIPNDAMHRDAIRKVPGYVMSLAYFFAFGATHCVAWNFDFPTAVERLLWRLSSVVTAVALPFAYLISDPIWLKVFKLESQPRILELVEGSLLVLIVVVFILARLFITVEVVRSLAFLPPGAFIGTWTANIPHVG
ncbi:hypothetical protein VN97_g5395 [Penicillium thymicola]|uniref:Uncharacterized protein n=1 Tax=Penicillium thymicola TaxID=293382 RepID=A0AAI9X8Q5_PENTH|nr:hypothetical protein VN97_g5395 [Penicillium thymicola]